MPLGIFLKNFNHGQYRLIHIVYLVNFDQSLSTLHIVRSILNFAMFLANSNQEAIRTTWLDPYCPHKVFITFHQRLMLFSVSNAFKKVNRRQQNLTHIVLNIMIVFRSALDFPMFPTNFDRRIIQFDPCHVLRVLSKNIVLFISNTHKIRIQRLTSKMLTSVPLYEVMKYMKS